MTYEMILNAMKEAFFTKAGRDAEVFSELAVRFEIVASELFSLYCRCDYLTRQSFPQTAAGEALDFHAALRGMTRKTAAKAEGALTFSVSEEGESEVRVPAGTICSAEGQPYLQFITTAEGTIPAGALSCTVPARACESGSRYNLGRGRVTVMVNPPLSVAAVTNESAFTHGSNAESDSALRTRLLLSFGNIPTGFSEASLREQILTEEDVRDCRILTDGEAMEIVVRTESGAVSADLEARILGKLWMAELLGLFVSVTPAQAQPYTLFAELYGAGDTPALRAQAEEIIRTLTDSIGIGESVPLGKIAYALSGIDGLDYAEVTCPTAADGVVYGASEAYLIPETVTVICHD